ncbi:MAG: hypothetical protein EAX95_03775 [Candidatus Thorarchaeota archaeon]|nr:hypothetical protein [Candidatus Thorarchaeota archaeon]
MPEIDNDEYIPRYKRGFEWFSHLVKNNLSGRSWKRLGIFSFYDAPYAESDRLYLSPKQVMLAMAAEAKKKEQGLVFVVDALEKGEMGLSTEAGFDQFMNEFDHVFKSSKKYYFGPKDSERTWLHEYPPLKIPLKWLMKRPNRFAEVLSDASPVGERIGPGDASFENMEGMIEVLIEKLGPPSLTEEVMGKIRSTEASEYAGEAVGLMTVFISPATAVSRGVKYLGKFMSLVKDRRKQEVKEVYEEWTQRVTEGYSEENLLKFFETEEDTDSELIEALSNYSPVLLILETRGTLYDLFMPLILQHMVEEIGFIPVHRRPKVDPKQKGKKREDKSPEEKAETPEMTYDRLEEISETDLPPVTDSLIQAVIDKEMRVETEVDMAENEYEGKPETLLFLDAATHLSKFRESFKFAINLPEKYPNISVAASFFTDREKVSKTLEEGVLDYMSEHALVFDLHPGLFDLATFNMPVSKKAWLLEKLQEMERVRSEGEVAFLEYNHSLPEKWKLHRVERPEPAALARLRSWFARH